MLLNMCARVDAVCKDWNIYILFIIILSMRVIDTRDNMDSSQILLFHIWHAVQNGLFENLHVGIHNTEFTLL